LFRRPPPQPCRPHRCRHSAWSPCNPCLTLTRRLGSRRPPASFELGHRRRRSSFSACTGRSSRRRAA
ncbi:unnamed protein product, partial [Ixodes pacificus]